VSGLFVSTSVSAVVVVVPNTTPVRKKTRHGPRRSVRDSFLFAFDSDVGHIARTRRARPVQNRADPTERLRADGYIKRRSIG
jgi:hypothetical protein